MTKRQMSKWLTPEAGEQMFRSQCLKRKLWPLDIARVVVFLASYEAGSCMGQQYVVDCGWV